jgi:hypothetical protein
MKPIEDIIKNFFKVVNFDDFEEFLDRINEKKYGVSDTDMSSRIYNYYKANGLAEITSIPAKKEKKRKVAILSAVEVIWINILSRMKEIGIDNEEVADIKKILLSKFVLKSEKNKKILKTLVNRLAKEEIIVDEEIDYEELKNISPTILEYLVFFHVKTNRIGGLIFTDELFSFFIDLPIYTIKERFEIMENYFMLNHRFFSFSSLMGKIRNDFTTHKVNVPIMESDDIWETVFDSVFEGNKKIAKYDNHFEVKERKNINPKDKKIEIIASEEKDQDIILKIRDGKKVTIEQVILKKKF